VGGQTEREDWKQGSRRVQDQMAQYLVHISTFLDIPTNRSLQRVLIKVMQSASGGS
jgi:hypothetical protein